MLGLDAASAKARSYKELYNYLDNCEAHKLNPAYQRFSGHENYYKLLADFSLYDSKGNYAPHRKVAYEMPTQVPYLDKNGAKKYMDTKAYIKAELEGEMAIRDDLSEALADESENGIIPQFVKKANELYDEMNDVQWQRKRRLMTLWIKPSSKKVIWGKNTTKYEYPNFLTMFPTLLVVLQMEK